jgi:DNA polymerase-1
MLKEMIESALKHGFIVFDVEHDTKHDPDHPEDFELWGVVFATPDMTRFVTDKEEIAALADALLLNDKIEQVAHNLKYDDKSMKAAGYLSETDTIPNPRCTMAAENMLHDHLNPKQLGLKPTVKRRYGTEREDYKASAVNGPNDPKFIKYACDDGSDTARLWIDQKKELKKEGLDKNHAKIASSACAVFGDLERFGIKWDIRRGADLLHEFQLLKEKTEEEIYKEIGHLNLNSGQQLGKRLFEELGYSTAGIKKTPKGDRYSVDAAAMDILASRHPVCAKIKLYRTAAKMVSTYIEPLTSRALKRSDRRIHCNYWLVSSTGRTRCDNPNLQNIPTSDFGRDANIRTAFIPEDGWIYLTADLSQIELRVIAHITQDKLFLKAYREYYCGACDTRGSSEILLHKCPHCGAEENEIVLENDAEPYFYHGLDIHSITSEKVSALRGNRKAGKVTNFAVVYGASPTKMNGIFPALSKGEWSVVIDEYMHTYANVPLWHASVEYLMDSTGIITDIFGRKRRISKMEIRKSRKHALNQAVNFVPQASACQLIQLNMMALRKRWIEAGLWGRLVKIVNFVHDEIVVETHHSVAEQIYADIRDCMENTIRLSVPVRTGIECTFNWGEAK